MHADWAADVGFCRASQKPQWTFPAGPVRLRRYDPSPKALWLSRSRFCSADPGPDFVAEPLRRLSAGKNDVRECVWTLSSFARYQTISIDLRDGEMKPIEQLLQIFTQNEAEVFVHEAKYEYHGDPDVSAGPLPCFEYSRLACNCLVRVTRYRRP